jgi:integrase
MSRDPHLVRRRGRRKWYIVDGNRRISTGAEDRAEAQRILDAYLDAKSRPLDPTVDQILDIRIADATARGLLTIKNMRQQHRQLRRFFGYMRAGDITPATAIRYIEARSPARTASRRELEELVTAYKTIGITLPKLPLPPNGPPRDEVMTRGQVHTLLAACKSYHLRLWCLIALTTGRRKSAILDLTWDRVDLGRGILDFDVPGRRHTKKRRGVATIPGPLLAALRDAQEIAVTPYVIEYCGKRVGYWVWVPASGKGCRAASLGHAARPQTHGDFVAC